MKSLRNNIKTENIIYTIFFFLLIIITYAFYKIQFEVNDDLGIMQFIAGYRTGKPELFPSIMSVLYSFPISKLYMWIETIPWFIIMFLFIDTVSVAVIFSVYVFSSKNKLISFLFFLAIYIGIIWYVMINITYTTVPALTIAATCLLAMYVTRCSEKLSYFLIVLFAVFSFLSTNIRMDDEMVLLPVLGYVLFGGFLLSKNRANKKKAIVLLFICLSIVVISHLVNNTYINNTGWKEFEKLRDERTEWKDYSHLSYEGNEDLYNSLGWDESIYELAENWCFIDEVINVDAFSKLNEEYRAQKQGNIFDINTLRNEFSYLIKEIPLVSVTAISWLGIILFALYELWKNKRSDLKYEYMYSIGFFFIFWAFIIYLCYFGRIPLRTINLSIIATIVPGLYSICILFEKIDCKLTKWYRLLIIVIFIIPTIFTGYKNIVNRSINSYDKINSVYKIINNNRENLYIYDRSMSASGDPFQVYADYDGPYNYIFWGGWLMHSPMQDEQIKKNNMDKLTLDYMLNDNCYFIGQEKYMTMLNKYYESRYENVVLNIESIGAEEYYVYSFRINQ